MTFWPSSPLLVLALTTAVTVLIIVYPCALSHSLSITAGIKWRQHDILISLMRSDKARFIRTRFF